MSMIATLGLGVSATLVSFESDEPFSVNRYGVDRMEIVANEPFTLESLADAVRIMHDEAKTYGYGKALIKFSEPCSVYIRGKYKVVSEFQARLFFGSKANVLCYTVNRNSGPYLDQFSWYKKIHSLTVTNPDHVEKKKAEAVELEKLFNRVCKARYDDQTWSDLKKDSLRDSKKSFYYIEKVFDHYDMEIIRKAFAEKTKFSIRKNDWGRSSRSTRDFSAEGRMGEDGIYRAWFSSEFSGCGNGDYYFLLSPRVAVFCERD